MAETPPPLRHTYAPTDARAQRSAACNERYLYRLWSDTELIYVGMTWNPHARLGVHATRAWWPEVVMVELELVRAEDAAAVDLLARELERIAIRTEQPRENRAGR